MQRERLRLTHAEMQFIADAAGDAWIGGTFRLPKTLARRAEVASVVRIVRFEPFQAIVKLTESPDAA